jgi:hypothetical protein
MMLCLGPLSGLLSPLQPKAEARTIAISEERAVPSLTTAPRFTSPLDESQARGAGRPTAVRGQAAATPTPAEGGDRSSSERAPVPATIGPTPTPESPLKNSQMVVFYGSPVSSELGILGMFPPEEAAQRAKAEAEIYDGLNGNRGAFGAMDLIYSQVQAEPTENGLYLRYLDDSTVQEYLDLADKYDLQLILDLQIGRSTVEAEVEKIERFLKNRRVHVAIDPEYAVGPDGIPLDTPGRVYGDDLNRMQDVLTDIVDQNQLPPKMAIVHQYLDDTIQDGGATKKVPEVDLVLNMDAFGDAREKNEKYEIFSTRPYASRRSFNIFLQQDERVLSEQEALDLTPPPDAIFYQ